jgi:hypothetical protein
VIPREGVESGILGVGRFGSRDPVIPREGVESLDVRFGK